METDCRNEVGITVSLIDGIIAIARVLHLRDLSDPAVREALLDLQSDEDIAALLSAYKEASCSSFTSTAVKDAITL